MSKNVITLPNLILKVANGAGFDPATSRRFLHDLFALVEEKLLRGESVAIPGIGEFTVGMAPDHAVLFRPDPSLSATANEPFSAFSPVELYEGAERALAIENSEPVDKSVLREEASRKPEPEQPAPVAETPAAEEIPAPAPEAAAEEPVKDAEEEKKTTTEPVQAAEKPVENTVIEKPEPQATVQTPVADPVETRPRSTFIPPKPVQQPPVAEPVIVPPSNPEPVYVPSHRTSHTIWLVLGIMIGLVAGLVGGYFAGKSMGRVEGQFVEGGLAYEDEDSDEDIFSQVVADTNESEKVAAEAVEVADSAASVVQPEPVVEEEVQAAPEPVYDYVTKNLAHLSQKHYGKKNYWVFIYKANPNLGNPNMIAPNTKVRIPAYEEFAGKTKTETDDKARRIYNELAKKYKF